MDKLNNFSYHIYALQDFYRKKNGKYMIVAKEVGNPRGVFKIPATQLITNKKELLDKFSLDDKVNIIGIATTESPPKISVQKTEQFKFFPILAMIFGSLLVVSNITSSKLITIYGMTFTGGTLSYILTYAFGDLLTEVYGYKRVRQLIWGAIICNLVVVLFINLSIQATPSPFWQHQSAYSMILGSVPRIVIASIISYMFSEFLNSYVIARLKVLQNGKRLWIRVICSSIVAMTVDNFLFLAISYFNVMSFSDMVQFSSRSYLVGLLFEWICIPLITLIANKLKDIENIDVFDINTNFNPFSLDVDYTDHSIQ